LDKITYYIMKNYDFSTIFVILKYCSRILETFKLYYYIQILHLPAIEEIITVITM